MSQPANEDVKTTIETPKDGAADDKAAAFTDPWKKFAFAAMGAVNLSPEEVTGFVKRLVEKGEIAKKDGEKIVKSFAERVQKTVTRAEATVKAEVKPALAAVESLAKAATGDAEKALHAAGQEKLAEKINASIERVLHGMNIATRKDVSELTTQLEQLDKKLGKLLGVAEVVAEKAAPRKTEVGAGAAVAN